MEQDELTSLFFDGFNRKVDEGGVPFVTFRVEVVTKKDSYVLNTIRVSEEP